MDENSRPRKQARLDTFLIPEFRIQELFEPLFKEK
jgi:hypothetical protein